MPADRPKRTGAPPIPRKKKIRKFKRYPRGEQLKQMLRAAKKWIVDQGFLRDEVIYGLLPGAKKWLDLNRGASFPEYPLRPAALLLKTRPPNFKEDYGPAGMPERFAACADWFKSWLAHCAPLDPSLREEVVNTLLDWAKATLPVPHRDETLRDQTVSKLSTTSNSVGDHNLLTPWALFPDITINTCNLLIIGPSVATKSILEHP